MLVSSLVPLENDGTLTAIPAHVSHHGMGPTENHCDRGDGKYREDSSHSRALLPPLKLLLVHQHQHGGHVRRAAKCVTDGDWWQGFTVLLLPYGVQTNEWSHHQSVEVGTRLGSALYTLPCCAISFVWLFQHRILPCVVALETTE